MEVRNLNGPVVFTPKVYPDRRGSFRELYNQERYAEWVPPHAWVQINHSISRKRTIRGLHFREGEDKFVTVVRGEVWDVLVDIRPESERFGQYHRILLKTGDQLYVPDGFAHSFEVISSKSAEVVYLTNKLYDPSLSRALAWNDPVLNIPWDTKHPILSKQDRENPSWEDYVKSLDTRR